MHELELLREISIALAVGLAGGLLARAVNLSAIVGYIAAGLVIGPFTPGYVANVDAIKEMAEVGVVFLMFGVGLHFRPAQFAEMRGPVLFAALVQIAIVLVVGLGGGWLLGLPWQGALVLGMALSISSTVVAMRSLEERGLLGEREGRVSVAWLIIQDILTIGFLVALPSLSPDGEGNVLAAAAGNVGRAVVFVALALAAGRWLVPVLLDLVTRSGSRELFIVAVVATAFGAAASATSLGLSVELGAFIGGVMLSEHRTSRQAAHDVLPLREAFAALFFVAVGMLLDPSVLASEPALVGMVAAIIIGVKGLVAWVLLQAWAGASFSSRVVAVSLAHSGEFSFIIARNGVDEGILSAAAYNAVLAGCVLSIAANSLLFRRATRSLPHPIPNHYQNQTNHVLD